MMSTYSRRWRGLLLASSLMLAPGVGRAEFALRDGDTVIFLGDSITAARGFDKVVENYTLLRFPGRKVRFVNSGQGGDTAAGGSGRLERDVFALGATVLVVAYGINDIGWGTKADEEHKRAYLDAIRVIVERCRERHVRVFICSAAITAGDPESAEGGFLQAMCDEGMAIARERSEGTIDVQRTMRAIQRKVRAAAEQAGSEKDRPTLHAPDGVHLNDLGQLAMALAILKGLGAPADVSSATLDARVPATVEANACRLTNLAGDASLLEFDRLDEGLPVNFGAFGALQFRFVPVPEELNRYLLTVRGLPVGRYEILADGRPLGSFREADLESGVNLSSATANAWEPGGPWDAQATALIRLTNSRAEVAQSRAFIDQFLPDLPEKVARREHYEDLNARVEGLQRALVRPRAFHFVIRPGSRSRTPP
jgi:lysophospholipase L1-like esterase